MFKYFNPNPIGETAGRDCTVRSLCASTGLSWEIIYSELCKIGGKLGCMPICTSVFRTYVNKSGFKHIKKCRTLELKVKDICNLSKKNKCIYLCLTPNHAVCCNNGVIMDTWDCSNEFVKEYWVKTDE